MEVEAPPTQTRPQRQGTGGGGWFTRIKNRVLLALEGNEDDLQIVNLTAVPWYVYHRAHLLGILDPLETRTYRVRKHGNLNTRPSRESEAPEYLVIDLNQRVQRVEIYRRQMTPTLQVYDLRVA